MGERRLSHDMGRDMWREKERRVVSGSSYTYDTCSTTSSICSYLCPST